MTMFTQGEGGRDMHVKEQLGGLRGLTEVWGEGQIAQVSTRLYVKIVNLKRCKEIECKYAYFILQDSRQ